MTSAIASLCLVLGGSPRGVAGACITLGVSETSLTKSTWYWVFKLKEDKNLEKRLIRSSVSGVGGGR